MISVWREDTGGGAATMLY